MNPIISVLHIVGVSTFGSLSGCTATNDPDGPTTPTFQELQTDLTAEAGEINSIHSQGFTPVAAFTNGSASYVGYVSHTRGGSILPPVDPSDYFDLVGYGAVE